MTADIQKRLIGPVIRLNPNDNVVVARLDVPIGMAVPGENFTSRSQMPAGYKIAARKILKGEPILKYNVMVGLANVDIELTPDPSILALSGTVLNPHVGSATRDTRRQMWRLTLDNLKAVLSGKPALTAVLG